MVKPTDGDACGACLRCFGLCKARWPTRLLTDPFSYGRLGDAGWFMLRATRVLGLGRWDY